MNASTYELVHVTARRFEASDSCEYGDLLELEKGVIFYQDSGTDTIWDALVNSEITEGFGVFIMEVMVFTFQIVSQWGLITQLQPAIDTHQFAFDQDVDAFVRLTRKHLQPQDVTAPDICLFSVVYRVEDFMLIGELDFEMLPYIVLRIGEDNG